MVVEYFHVNVVSNVDLIHVNDVIIVYCARVILVLVFHVKNVVTLYARVALVKYARLLHAFIQEMMIFVNLCTNQPMFYVIFLICLRTFNRYKIKSNVY